MNLMRSLRRVAILSIALTGWTAGLVGQQIITNSNGDKVIMYPDGSWRPIAPQDSVLLRQYLQRSSTPDESVPNHKKSRNKGEEEAYLNRQYLNLKQQIENLEKKVQNDFRTATNNQFKAAEQLHQAQANVKLLEPQYIMNLSEAYDKSVADLRKAKLNQKAVRKLFHEMQQLAAIPSELSARKLNKLEARYTIYVAAMDPSSVANVKPEVVKELKQKEAKSTEKNNTALEKIRLEKPVAATPANEPAPTVAIPSSKKTAPETYISKPYDCSPSRDTIDETTGRNLIELPFEIVFTHTDPDLRPFLKDKELITGKGRLWKIGPYVYLDMEFQIASSHSQNNFGGLQIGSLLRVKLMNEDLVSLYNLKADRGHIDAYTGNTVFSGQYALGKDEIKKLKGSGLDKVRVLWGTGYEDYDVYSIDFLIDQIGCLLQH